MTYDHYRQHLETLPRIERELGRIANCLEGLVLLMRQELSDDATYVDADSLGAAALWREQVAQGNTLVGFSDWLAWHKADPATTPEDIENYGEAIKAVKRGFAEMERQVKGEGDATD